MPVRHCMSGRSSLIGISLFLLAASVVSHAQEQVVVSGSYIGDDDSPSPGFSIDRDDIERNGFFTVPQLIDALPKAQV